MSHRAGFVSIIGLPNAGKSTLMNELVGERLSIITPKAQTTRHRILGIKTGDGYQIVYSDTPGMMEPHYALHEAMVRFIKASLEDADLVVWVVDASLSAEEQGAIPELLQQSAAQLIIVLNKIDLLPQSAIAEAGQYWRSKFPQAKSIIGLSALNKFNVSTLEQEIIALLPEHPAYYEADELTDKTERFLAAELIREQIFYRYKQEIPYSCQVEVVSFKPSHRLLSISAVIYVERESQKGILIGEGGKALKQVATSARKVLENYFGKKVFLETTVKVEENWRTDPRKLDRMGFQ